MNKRQISAILMVMLIAAGCWSARSKAGEPLPDARPSQTATPDMTEQKPAKGFYDNLPRDFEMPTDDAGKLLLREYGAVFVARGGAVPPT